MCPTVRVPTTAGADARHVKAAVSRRLRELRKQQGLSLDEMSRRSSISKGMLVEIEKGHANPSIAILCKAAAVLAVSVADIVNVSEVSPFHIIHPKEMSSLWNGPDGGSAILLAGANGPDTVELWKWNMKAGEHYVSHGHPAYTTELLYVEAGELTFTLGESVIRIPNGWSIFTRTGRDHSYANLGTSELSFSMAVASLRR
jgi:transcriptional regulator with XRE-family HTH domain